MKIIHGDITLESGKTMSAQEVDQLADDLATNDYEWTSLDSFPAEAQCSRTRLQSFISFLTFQSIRKQKRFSPRARALGISLQPIHRVVAKQHRVLLVAM